MTEDRASLDLSLIRSMLFTPADRPERFAKAAASAADGVVLDLEDGVGLAFKSKARQAALAFLSTAPDNTVWALRINHVTTAAGLMDLLALRDLDRKPPLVMLPKTESVSEVAIALSHLGANGRPSRIVALIESAVGLAAADAIAAHPGVAALAFGGADLAADLQAEFDWQSLLFARSRLVQAAAIGRVAAWDVPFLDIADSPGLARETAAAKALGYTGKLAIHPAQIETINRTWMPGTEQLARAERIVAAFADAHGGVCVVDGKMVDLPVVIAAQRTIQLGRRTTHKSGKTS